MTQVKFKVKKGDTVQVITGKDKGKRGVVNKVLLSEAKLLVEGINQVTRNVKPSAQNPSGPYTKYLPIHVSNVAIVDASADAPSKVGYKVAENGEKVRFFKKTGHTI